MVERNLSNFQADLSVSIKRKGLQLSRMQMDYEYEGVLIKWRRTIYEMSVLSSGAR